jgi:hypothetical protein
MSMGQRGKPLKRGGEYINPADINYIYVRSKSLAAFYMTDDTKQLLFG